MKEDNNILQIKGSSVSKVIYLYGRIMNSQFRQALFSFTNVKWLIVYANECLVVSY